MTDSTPEVTVEVTAPPTEEAPPVTVVETGGDDGHTGGELDLARTVGELTATVNTLSATVSSMQEQLNRTEMIAESADETATQAVLNDLETEAEAAEVAAEVAEETAEEAVEDIVDEPPTKVHWAHRSLRDLIGNDQ